MSSDNRIENIKSLIRAVPDFPHKGILFRDVSTLMQDATGFQQLIDVLAEHYKDTQVDVFAGVESRGFIIGAALAYKLNKGFVMIRKKGKLPYKTISQEYALEYGTDKIEIHEDAIKPGQKVVVVDDLIATGGTLNAACTLVEKVGGSVVECCCPIELVDLKGRSKVSFPIYSIISYEGL